MKKYYVLLMAAMMSYNVSADDKLTLDKVKLVAGESANVSVKLDNAKEFVAFQFDMALPEGITLENATLSSDRSDGHEFKFGQVDGKYRFLVYHNSNKKLKNTSGALVNLTLKAAESIAEGSKITIDDEIFVTGDATGNDLASVSADVELTESQAITIPAGGKFAAVYDKDLDFSGFDDIKAFIPTGYDIESSTLWLSRVKDVPAGTPIVLKGAADASKNVPVGTSTTYYGENFAKGNATAAATVDWTDGYKNFVISQSKGTIGVLPETSTTIGAGKVYIHVPTSAPSKVGSDEKFTMPTGERLTLVSTTDLDFTDAEADGLKAFVVTGYGDGTIWLSRVMTATAGTPLLLKGTKDVEYTVKAKAAKVAYANMLRGKTEASPLNTTDGDYTNFVLSKGLGQFGPLASNQTAFPAGTAYLPLLTSKIPAKASARGTNGMTSLFEQEAEVIGISLKGIIGDGETTGIESLRQANSDRDEIYNLNGQRVENPRKGLYIINGKKVVIK